MAPEDIAGFEEPYTAHLQEQVSGLRVHRRLLGTSEASSTDRQGPGVRMLVAMGVLTSHGVPDPHIQCKEKLPETFQMYTGLAKDRGQGQRAALSSHRAGFRDGGVRWGCLR